MSLAERLKNLRSINKLTATEVATRLLVSKSTISNYEKGIRQPSIETLRKLAIIYGTTIESILNCEKGEKYNSVIKESQVQEIPILGIIRSGEPLYTEENIIGYTDLGREYKGKGNYFALYVAGDSMNNSRICDGDIVIVRKQDIVENGEIAVVIVGKENATIKKFFRIKNMVTLMPSSTNPIQQPRNIDLTKTPVEILGKVVEAKIKL